MRAGAQGMRTVDKHEDSVLLEGSRHFFRGAELRIDLEENDVGFKVRRIEEQARRIGDGLANDAGVAMVFSKTFEVMVQSVKSCRRQHSGMAHAAAKQCANEAYARDVIFRHCTYRCEWMTT